jgi:hypothetical protein
MSPYRVNAKPVRTVRRYGPAWSLRLLLIGLLGIEAYVHSPRSTDCVEARAPSSASSELLLKFNAGVEVVKSQNFTARGN